MSQNLKPLLAGDIGGTKTVLALYDPEVGPYDPIAQATFPSREYPSLEAIVAEFLDGRQVSVCRASFGIAGPVANGRVQATNLPWVVEEEAFGAWLHAPVRLLNDLAAVAHAVPNLRPQDVATLNEGTPVPQAPLGVVAPGTGLGEAFLLWIGGAYRPFASEAGHADFAPNTVLESDLLTTLRARQGHVSYEDVCSGRGLPNLYAFLRSSGRYAEPAWLAEELAAAPDATRVIVRVGVEAQAEIAVAALELLPRHPGGRGRQPGLAGAGQRRRLSRRRAAAAPAGLLAD